MYRESEREVSGVSEPRGSESAKSSDTGGKTVAAKGPRFTKGGEPGPGRPKQVDQRAYIAALAEEFPPDEIRKLVREAIGIARDTNSWRGVVAALEFAANYTLGKPKQRIESTGAVSIGDMLAGLDTSAPLLPDDQAQEDT